MTDETEKNVLKEALKHIVSVSGTVTRDPERNRWQDEMYGAIAKRALDKASKVRPILDEAVLLSANQIKSFAKKELRNQRIEFLKALDEACKINDFGHIDVDELYDRDPDVWNRGAKAGKKMVQQKAHELLESEVKNDE